MCSHLGIPNNLHFQLRIKPINGNPVDDFYTPLKGKDSWKICVKVFPMWSQNYMNNPKQIASHELILMDVEGNKICASIKYQVMPDFEDAIKEGNYCEVYNFGLGPYDTDYKLVDHNCKINFFRSTKVKRVKPFEDAVDGINLVSFDDILEWKVSTRLAFG